MLAAHALAGLLADPNTRRGAGTDLGRWPTNPDKFTAMVAERAVQYADAVLAELRK